MMLDGEWRVAFLKNEHPELKYATAPMPVADGHPELYGGGAVNGTIIGIPKGGKHRDQAWDARQVPDDERPRAGEVLERDPERPVDGQLVEVEGADPGQELRDVPEDLHQPALADDADHADRPRPPDDVHELHRQVAGREGEGPDRRLREVDKQIDAKIKQAGGGKVSLRDSYRQPRPGLRPRPCRCPTAGGRSERRRGASGGSCSS